MKKLTMITLAVAALLSACGGGGGSDTSSGPVAPSITPRSIAGVYENDALPGTSRMILDPDGTFWSLAVDRINNPTVAGVSTGLSSVSDSGVFSASGTGYIVNTASWGWSNFSINGNTKGDGHLTYTITAFNQTSGGSLSRIATGTTATGAIPSRTYIINPMISFTTSQLTEFSSSFVVNGTTVSGVSGGCSFTGTTTDNGLGYSHVSVRFANTNACLHPNQTVYGVATYDTTQQKLVVMLRLDPQPYTVYLGVSM